MHRFDSSRQGRWRWPTIALILLCLVTVACSDDDDELPTDPDDGGDVEIITETFNGTLMLGESSCHEFEVTQRGDITMIITEIQPLETLTLGLGIGVPQTDPDATDPCVFIAEDNSVRRLEALLTSNRSPGPHCVCVSDVGNIFPDVTISYTIDVSHP